MGKERPVPNKEYVIGRRNDRCRVGVEQATSVRSFEITEEHPSRFGNVIEKMTTVREELREPLSRIPSLRWSAQQRWLSATNRDALHRSVGYCGEQDHPISVPRSSGTDRRPDDDPRGPAVNVNSREAFVGKEANRAAVR